MNFLLPCQIRVVLQDRIRSLGLLLFILASNQIVLVELGSTQKASAWSSTKTYNPSEIVAVDAENPLELIQSTIGNPPDLVRTTAESLPESAQLIEHSAPQNVDGIEQVVADDLHVFMSPAKQQKKKKSCSGKSRVRCNSVITQIVVFDCKLYAKHF